MQKLYFIVEEFFRSFRKSLFKNILLMFMFSIGLLMAVLMGSYYLELGQQYSDAISYTEDGTWYDITVFDDFEEFTSSFVTTDGCINMLEYYDVLSHWEENPIYAAATDQGVNVREEDFKKIFHDIGYDGFLNQNHSTAFRAYFGDAGNGGQMETVLGVKSAQLDLQAYRIFALKTAEGEGFTEDNMTIKTAADTIPIVLGNDYKGIIPIGHKIDINIAGTGYVYPCEVVGILEQGMQIPENGDATQDMVTMDSYILFPYGIQVSDKQAEAGGTEQYAYLDLISLENAAVRMKNEDESIQLVNKFQKLGQEFGLPPVQLSGTSLGLDLFRKESATSVRVVLILTLVLIFFTFYGLFVTLYDKVQSNKRVYGIYLMNGCSIGTVIISYLLEIAVIMIPAICVCRYVFLNESVRRGADIEAILRAANCFAGASFVIGTVFIAIIMQGVNVEILIRQRD